MPVVTLYIYGCSLTLDDRVKAVIKGTRLANVLGRIPDEDSIASISDILAGHAFPTPAGDVTIFTHVDNLFAVSTTPFGAIKNLDSITEVLASNWGLEMKMDSRQLITPSREKPIIDSLYEWEQCDTTVVLGHTIHYSCSPLPAWPKLKPKLWASFFANAHHKKARKLPFETRLKLFDRCTTPLLDFQNSRLTPMATLLKLEDELQRKMVGILLQERKHDDEDIQAFIRRRSRKVTHVIKGKFWSERHRKCCQDWYHHLERHPDHRVHDHDGHDAARAAS